MNHLFVPHEIALKLKEKGFDEPCIAYYRELLGSREIIFKIDTENKPYVNSELGVNKYNMISAPIYQQVVDWLRDKHELHIKITRDGGWWGFTAHDLSDEDNSSPESDHNVTRLSTKDDYHEAFNTAIKEALKLI